MTDNINLETSEAKPEWTILYHVPGLCKGRGEFLRLMLEDKGISYVDTDENLYGPEGLTDVFRGSLEAIDADIDNPKYPYPTMFPPVIWHRPTNGDPQVLINQVAACMIYIGDVLGYAPSTIAEKAKANAILMNAIDYITDGRSSFHPVDNHASYKDQKEQGDQASLEFSQGRMKKYLHHFHKIVARNGGSRKPVAGGEFVTYADFALFHVLDATIAQFNTDFYDMAWDTTNVPALKDYHAWMKSRPMLQSYFLSDRCAPFAGDSMM
jgi:glutathione S-transferase